MWITTDLSTAIGQIRYMLGDDVEGTGVLPNGSNFTDAQITYELGTVGNSTVAAAAKLCSNLARRWSTTPQSFSADGLSINRGDMVAKWLGLQEEFSASIQGGSFGSVALDRQDAWSESLDTAGEDLTRED